MGIEAFAGLLQEDVFGAGGQGELGPHIVLIFLDPAQGATCYCPMGVICLMRWRLGGKLNVKSPAGISAELFTA